MAKKPKSYVDRLKVLERKIHQPPLRYTWMGSHWGYTFKHIVVILIFPNKQEVKLREAKQRHGYVKRGMDIEAKSIEEQIRQHIQRGRVPQLVRFSYELDYYWSGITGYPYKEKFKWESDFDFESEVKPLLAQ